MMDALAMGFGALSLCLFAAHTYDFCQDRLTMAREPLKH
jgi:hypothetical protein